MKKIIIIISIIIITYSLTSASSNKKKINEDKDIHIVELNYYENVKFVMKIIPFNENEHKILKKGNYLMSIDNKLAFPRFGGIPETEIKEAYLQIDDKKAFLNVSGMYDPGYKYSKYYNRGEAHIKKYNTLQKNGNYYLLECSFSDGAYGYNAKWLIIDHGTSMSSIRTYISSVDLDNIIWENTNPTSQ